MRRKFFRRAAYAFGVAVAFVLLALLLIPKLTVFRVAFVWGESVNVTLALAVPPVEKEMVQGEYVALNWSGHDPNNVPHLKTGATLVKRIGCAPGQFLQVTAAEARCNGILLGMIRTVSLSGLPLTPVFFNGVIPQGQYFMMGDHLASYDSRYLGLIPFEWVTARLAVKV